MAKFITTSFVLVLIFVAIMNDSLIEGARGGNNNHFFLKER